MTTSPMRRLGATLGALALGWMAVPATAAEGPSFVAVAGPGAAATNFATPVLVVTEGASLDLASVDAPMTHDFVQHVDADGVAGPDTNPWCAPFEEGECPAFWTPKINLLPGTGGPVTEVQGVPDLPVGEYTFHCTLHPNMEGTLVVVAEP